MRSKWETNSIVVGRTPCKLLVYLLVFILLQKAHANSRRVCGFIHLQSTIPLTSYCHDPNSLNIFTNSHFLPQILHYGAKVQPLSASANSFTHELYRSSNPESSSSNSQDNMAHLQANPKKGIKKVEQTPHAQFLAMLGAKSFTTKKPTSPTGMKTTPKTISASTTKTPSLTPGADAALAQLQSSMASENAKKAGNTYVWYSLSWRDSI